MPAFIGSTFPLTRKSCIRQNKITQTYWGALPSSSKGYRAEPEFWFQQDVLYLTLKYSVPQDVRISDSEILVPVHPYNFFPHSKTCSLSDVDAVGKPRSGYLRGNMVWLGSYSECRDISNAHYCTTALTISVKKSISPVRYFAFILYVVSHLYRTDAKALL